MKKSSFLIIASLFFTASLVHAQNSVVSVDEEESTSQSRLHFGKMQTGDRNNPEGLWPFLGAGVGVMAGSSSLRTGGLPMHIKAMGSYYFTDNPWIAEAGVGLYNQIFTQEGGGSDTLQAFYLEAGGRYRLENKWQAGPVLSTLIDTSNRFNSGNHDLTSFVGAQLLKEFTYNDYLMRAGGRVAVDMGISGSIVPVALFDLHITWGEAPAPVVEAAPVIEEKIVEEIVEEEKTISYDLNPEPVRFDTNKTVVVPDNKIYMKKLALVLGNNKDLYDRVEVIGHADHRGTEKYNKKLSKTRAINIATELKKAGLDNTRMVTEGKGYSQPRVLGNNADAFAKNRRVELKFIGVKDEKALSKLLQSIDNY